MDGQPVIAALDQGTTGTRCILFDRESRPVASAYRTHEQHYPHAGWVEHDPEEILENAYAVLEAALDEADRRPAELAAIGITNQRETTVVWEAASGTPIHNAIVWQDRRTTDRVEALVEDGWSDAIRDRTGLEPDAYFSATKVEWVLDHAADDLRERARRGEVRFGTIDSWLIDRLTGEHVTEVTNAARTMLFDIHEQRWDPALLAEFDVPEAMLPAVRPSIDDEPYGTTDPEGRLGAAIPVAAALGDQQAALFGQTCFDAGEAKNTYGTGSFVLLNTGTDAVSSDHGLVTTIAYGVAGEPTRYALEGSIFVTGAAVQWLVDVGLIDDADETERLAGSVEDTNGVYVVPAFTGLGAPHWDQRARGTIVGLTRDTSRAHLVRATLESIAFQTRDVVEAMTADAGTSMAELRIDGGAVENDLLCQLQADILESAVTRPTIGETTALGAAYAAGLTVGFWDSREELRDHWQVETIFEPTAETADVDRRYERWRDALSRARDWAHDG